MPALESVQFTTYNLLNLFAADTAEARRHYETIAGVIRALYADVEWFADLIYQCQWDYDEQGRRRHWADRRPGDVLWAGGLHDAAAVTGAEWRATTGHHPADVYGAHGVRRRIDAVRVTGPMAAALRAHHVLDTEQTRAASD